jgi:hypothetical protein
MLGKYQVKKGVGKIAQFLSSVVSEEKCAGLNAPLRCGPASLLGSL